MVFNLATRSDVLFESFSNQGYQLFFYIGRFRFYQVVGRNSYLVARADCDYTYRAIEIRIERLLDIAGFYGFDFKTAESDGVGYYFARCLALFPERDE